MLTTSTAIRHNDCAKEAMLTTLATSRGATRHTQAYQGSHVNGDAAACNQACQGIHVNDSAMHRNAFTISWVTFGPDAGSGRFTPDARRPLGDVWAIGAHGWLN